MANENIQELKFQVGEAWKGVYSSTTAYGLANVVQDPTGLSIYRSLKSGNMGHPVSDRTWWFCIIDLSSIKAESDRIAALNEAIAQDEALRVAAEELRQQHEAERVAAETQRNEAEQARISAEQARVNAESARATAEQQRITAEQGRVSAESARVQAEQARVLAETLRANAEDQRAANEQNRVAAEQQRIERAEQDHQRAESDHATYVDSLGAFDISSYHATDGVLAKYADLTAALGTNGANIPDDLRKGGMSVKFVQSSDNKYVQFRCMAQNFTTDTTLWQGVDDEPTPESKNLVESGGVNQQIAEKVGGVLYDTTIPVTQGTTFSKDITIDFHVGDEFDLKLLSTELIDGAINAYLYYGQEDTERIGVAVSNGETTHVTCTTNVIKIRYGRGASGVIGTGNIEVVLSVDGEYYNKEQIDDKISQINGSIGNVSDTVIALGNQTRTMSQQIDDISEDIYGIEAAYVDVGSIDAAAHLINVSNDEFNHLVKSVNPGDSIKIVASSGTVVDYCVLTSYPSVITEDVALSTSSSISGRRRLSDSNGLIAEFTVPQDSHYIVTSRNYNTTNNLYQPSVFQVNGNDVLNGVPGIEERVKDAEEELVDIKKNAKGFLIYSNNIAENAFSDGVHPAFDFYSPDGKGNFFGFRLELCKHLADDFYQYLWRVTTCGYYSYNESTGIFTLIADTLQGNENEFAFSPKDFHGFESYIGGYHGGERIDLDATNCYVKFFADGEILNIDNNTANFTKRCTSFRYYQRASMHIVNDNTSNDVVAGHPIFAYHIKDNLFENCGFHLENTLDVLSDAQIPYQDGIISDVYYAGLLCVRKGIGQNVILPDGVFKQAAGDNSYVNATNKAAKTAIYWNTTNKISATASSELEQGLSESDVNVFMVWDRVYDTKYYRGINGQKNLTDIGIIRSKVDLQFK